MLNSQRIRNLGPEIDPLWIGSGKSLSDISKPQILVESTAGDSHPGSRHLFSVVESVKNSVYASQAMPSVYTVTDMCDGAATGHSGMNYSLVSRNVIAGMVEIHAKASGFDGIVAISTCDKAIPGHLMSILRLDIPAIHICGGSMAPGPNFISADTCYETNLRVSEGKMTKEEELYFKRNACPSCGACQYMGTASTMQCMSEALGMALPSNALVPANGNIINQIALDAGKRIAELVNEDLRPSKILTKSSFENAIKIHAAIGGSANAVLHIPAVAKEMGIEITLDDFERLSKGVPLLTSIMTAGKWPTQYFWYAGGIPRIIKELQNILDMDALTVTGHTLGENMEYLEKIGYFRRSDEYMKNFNLKASDIIKPFDSPEDTDSGISILKGNLAENGSVIKHCAVDKSMYYFEGKAKVFENEESAEEAIYNGTIKPGDVVVIRYVGQKAAGMPEMLKATDAVCNKEELNNSCALITDGRFSGASRGPCVGYLFPEAAEGGTIAYIDDGDIIEIDINKKSINVVGFRGEKHSKSEVEAELKLRRTQREHKTFKHKGVLRFLDLD